MWVVRQLEFLDDDEHNVAVFSAQERAYKYMHAARKVFQRFYEVEEWFLDPPMPVAE